MIRFMLIIFLSLCTNSLAQDDILARIDNFRVPFDQFTFHVKLENYKNDKLIETAKFKCYVGGNDRTVVVASRFSKHNKLKILYFKDNMWALIGDSKRPLKMTPMQRLMGNAANGDVARINYTQDYHAKVLNKETIDNIPCLKVELTAKRESTTYHKIIMYVKSSNFQPIKAEHFLISGKLFKTSYFDKYKKVNDRMILCQFTIYDALRKDSKTVFSYSDFKKEKLPNKYFNKNYLIYIR